MDGRSRRRDFRAGGEDLWLREESLRNTGCPFSTAIPQMSLSWAITLPTPLSGRTYRRERRCLCYLQQEGRWRSSPQEDSKESSLSPSLPLPNACCVGRKNHDGKRERERDRFALSMSNRFTSQNDGGEEGGNIEDERGTKLPTSAFLSFDVVGPKSR